MHYTMIDTFLVTYYAYWVLVIALGFATGVILWGACRGKW